jgi:hypothetical protein
VLGWLAALALVAGCGSDGTTVSTGVAAAPGAESGEEAIAALVQALAAGDWDGAFRLSDAGQMVAVALAEGTTIDEGLALLEGEGVEEVGANFWQGFAEGVGEFLGVDPSRIRLGESASFAAAGSEFVRVAVLVPLDAAPRSFVARSTGAGWKVDVVATFPAALAPRLGDTAEAVGADPQGGPLLGVLREQRVGLEAALTDPELSPELRQTVLAALEVLTR